MRLSMTGTSAEKKSKIFALVLTAHRLWGSVLLPYLVRIEQGRSYNRLSECLFPYPGNEALTTLNAEERDIVNIINEYNERNLFKLFSKDKTVKDFLVNITAEKHEKFLRPYIERRLYKCFTIARDESIPVYYQKTKSEILYSEDLLHLNEENAEPVFIFSRDNGQSTYKLSLETGGKLIDMKKSSIDILTMSPCLIREDHRVLFVSDVDGFKLKPFLIKEFIQIPKKTELKYFGSFVLNAINNFKVEGIGFGIIEFKPEKEACLQIEIGLKGSPVLILIFNYQGNRIFSSETRKSFTIFEHKDDNFIFRKYHRDLDWENECKVRLEELGFFSDDDINYLPVVSEKKGENELYTMIEAVNSNYPDIIDAGFVLTSRLKMNFNFKPVTIELSSKLINDWFDLKAIVKIGQWEIPFTRFRKNIISGIREYELPDGTIAILPEAWFSKYKNIFEFGKSSDDTLKLHKQHFSLLSDTLSDEGKPGFDKLEKLLIPERLPEVELPEGLNCIMRNYQAEGLNWLNFLQTSGLGGCLADDMGLGKTIQTLALLQHNKENLQPVNDTGRNR